MITLFTKQGCVYCTRAIDLLNRENVTYQVFDMTNDEKGVQELLAKPEVKQYNHRTFPFVFDDGKFLGGYTELYEAFEHGFLNHQIEEDFF